MQLLKDLDINGISIDMQDVKNGSVMMRIINKSEDVYTSLRKSQYISVSRGVIPLRNVVNIDITISAKSFVVLKMPIYIPKFENGDRIELNFKNFATIKAEFQSGIWYVSEYENRKESVKCIESRCMRLETIEEQFNISIQNISVNVEEDEDNNFWIKSYCEVISVFDRQIPFDISIVVAIYDKHDTIIGSASVKIHKSKFMCFDVLAFKRIRIDVPLKDIYKIVFYPKKS